jgi:hypothetical protein
LKPSEEEQDAHPNPSEEQKRNRSKMRRSQKDYEKARRSREEKRKNYAKDLEYLHLHAQMVFQDPYSSLDPRMTVEDIIAEPLDAHKSLLKKNAKKKASPIRISATNGSFAHDDGRSFFGTSDPLPPRILGRPASAYRHRAEPCPQSGVGRLR